MNTTKLLELTTSLKSFITIDNGGWLALEKVQEIEKIIKQEILEQETKKAGGNTEKNRLKKAQKYIEDTRSYYKDDQQRIKKFVGAGVQDGKQWLCNGFCLIGLSKHIQGLQEVEDPMNYKSVFPNYEAYLKQIDVNIDFAALRLQLKEANAEEKANNKGKGIKGVLSDKRLVAIGNQWFDVKLFLKVTDILAGDNYTYYQSPELNRDGNNVQPFVVVSGEDVAMILPVNKPKPDNNDVEESAQ